MNDTDGKLVSDIYEAERTLQAAIDAGAGTGLRVEIGIYMDCVIGRVDRPILRTSVARPLWPEAGMR